MQTWRGKAWEIWLRAVPSDRRMVDTWGGGGGGGGAVPNEVSRCLFMYCPSRGWMSECKADNQYRSLFTTPAMDQRETGFITVGHHLPMCLHSVYLTSSQTSQTFPRHICIPQAINIGSGNGLAYINLCCWSVTHNASGRPTAVQTLEVSVTE